MKNQKNVSKETIKRVHNTMKIQPTPPISKRWTATSEERVCVQQTVAHCDADLEQILQRPSERKLDIRV